MEYGSSSDSDSDSSAPATAQARKTTNTTASISTSSSTLGLLVNYGDDDSESESGSDSDSAEKSKDEQRSVNEPLNKRPKLSTGSKEDATRTSSQTMDTTRNASIGNKSQASESEKVKGKDQDANKDIGMSMSGGLPLPRLARQTIEGNDNDNDNSSKERNTARIRTHPDDPYTSLILFTKNYIQENESSTSTFQLEDETWETLNQLRQKQRLSKSTSFADTLRSQKEFGNPHLFHSVMDYFEIDPMASNIDLDVTVNVNVNEDVDVDMDKSDSRETRIKMVKSKDKFEKFEYLDRLMQKEEENRIRDISSL